MERSLAKLVKELKGGRQATQDEVLTLISTIEAQDKRVKIEALKARLRALQG